ncbi:MAG: hypothetical protein GF398_21905 [Chitinivibrionales bacterium]|nr:hypothetical protein [Chitinivibrionales bacterium]
MADIIVFATSSARKICAMHDFRPGAIVCDASLPADVDVSFPLRKDILVYHGGIAHVPVAVDPCFDIGLASTETFYGCQLESMLIALNPDLPDSKGRSIDNRENVEKYLCEIEKYESIRVCYSVGNYMYAESEIEAFVKGILN